VPARWGCGGRGIGNPVKVMFGRVDQKGVGATTKLFFVSTVADGKAV
jgi:hypothetical protein